MNLVITQKTEKPFLDKMVVSGIVTGEKGTPPKEEVKKELAKQTATNEDLITVDKIVSSFGGTKASFCASIYANETTKAFFKRKEKKAAPAAQGGQ